ncbi:MAG: MFS transporter [Paludibaculum sp.]
MWAGQAISQIGSNITSVGLPLTAVVVLKASPLQMGFLAGASALPVLALGLIAGAWADRLRRRPILIAADLGRAVVLGLIPLAAVLHRLRIEHLYMAAAASGLLTVLFDVSYQAYLPSLVSRENLLEGNSKLAATESFAEVVGPGFTGILVQLMTAPMAILIDAGSFVCSAFSVWLIRRPEPKPSQQQVPQIWREILEGLRAVWRNRLLRALAGRATTGAFFLGFGSSLYFLFVMRELGLSAALVGVIISAGGSCGLLGAVVTQRLVARFGVGAALIGSSLLIGLAMLLVPLAHGSATVCAAFLVASQVGDLAWPVYLINDRSLRQATTPDEFLGRVNSALHLMYHGALPLGALTGGAVAQVMGVRSTLFAGALGFLLSSLWLICSPARRLSVLPPAADERNA